MGLRFRKSIKICKGVRLNVSKSGLGISFGVRGARFSISPTGRKTTSIGIPGTGIFYTSSTSANSVKPMRNTYTLPEQRESTRSVPDVLPEGASRTSRPLIDWDNYIDIITKVHENADAPVQWQALANCPPPFEKGTHGPQQTAAEAEYKALKPTFHDKIFPKEFQKRKDEAYRKVAKGAEADLKAYDNWYMSHSCAEGILARNINSYYDAINSTDFFADFSSYGCDFEFGTECEDSVMVSFDIKDTAVMPSRKYVQRDDGAIGTRKLTLSEYNTIKQDYVCSVSIRLARELFALLPIDRVIINAESADDQTILAVRFDRKTFDQTDFHCIDASDYIDSFPHHMEFLKTKGFSPVKPIREMKLQKKETDQVTTAQEDTEKELSLEWYEDNSFFVRSNDDKMNACRKKIEESIESGVDAQLDALNDAKKCYLLYQKECSEKGPDFLTYFEQAQKIVKGETKDQLTIWQEQIQKLETNYLALREKEDAISDVKATLKTDIIAYISSNPGLLQKDIPAHYSPYMRKFVLSTLRLLEREGTLEKEKSGNSYKLYIKTIPPKGNATKATPRGKK